MSAVVLPQDMFLPVVGDTTLENYTASLRQLRQLGFDFDADLKSVLWIPLRVRISGSTPCNIPPPCRCAEDSEGWQPETMRGQGDGANNGLWARLGAAGVLHLG